MGSGHLPDLTIVTPIFRHGRLVVFVGSIAHAPDVSEAAEQVYRVAINAERWEVGVERTRALRE